MTIPVVGLGAGGHAKVVIEILRLDARYELVGLLDPKPELQGTQILGVPIIGNDDTLPELTGQGVRHFFVGLGSIGNTVPRRKLYALAQSHGLHAVSAIHPTAIISPSVVLGEGLTVMAGAIINADVRLGANVIVNSGAIVEHDCIIGDHVHIATGVRLTSTVTVGTGSHIGAGAIVRQCVVLGEKVTVGAGAVVVKDVPAYTVVIGVPAQPLRMNT